MSSKDDSVTSAEGLMSTSPGRRILKEGLLKSQGYRLFQRYQREYKEDIPGFHRRFRDDLYRALKSDQNPLESQKEFAREISSEAMMLEASQIDTVRANLLDADTLGDRVGRILDSNFVKMTFPIFNALYDAAAEFDGRDKSLRRDIVDGHILAIDLSEPMDRIVDRDEDLEYLDDYKLMLPYILGIARKKIALGGEDILKSFEEGFKSAMAGQEMDVDLKSRPTRITGEEMMESYKKYRSVMGTAGYNMALGRAPLAEIFSRGMACSAEGVGCGNEIEDSLKSGAVKIPSWPLYYSILSGDVEKGFDLTMRKASLYLDDARLVLETLPDGFAYKGFLEFLFLTVDHYTQFWYRRLRHAGIWDKLAAGLPGEESP